MSTPNQPAREKLDQERQLRQILIRRLYLLAPLRCSKNVEVTPTKKATFFAELAKLGYRIVNPNEFHDDLLTDYDTTISTLTKMRGGDVTYVPLFQGFPESVPDQDQYFVNRIIGYLGNIFEAFEEGKTLKNGIVVPEWLFNLDGFGADPITQMQDAGLFQKGATRQAKRSGDTETQWIDLSIVDSEEATGRLHAYLRDNLYSASSIKEAVRDDVQVLLRHFDADSIEFERIIFKETRTLVTQHFWENQQYDLATDLLETPTDLLRLFAGLTGTDVSLAETIRFPRLNRQQRRIVLECLERASSLCEDLNRHRGLWLAVAKSLHAHEYSDRFPKACAAIAELRTGSIRTFGSQVQLAINDRKFVRAIELLKTRPGVFARRLQELTSAAGEIAETVIDEFASVADQVALKNLLVMETHYRTARESPYRVVINKRGRVRVIESRDPPLAPHLVKRLLVVFHEAIQRKIHTDHSSWNGKRVFVESGLRDYTVPLSQRKASDGMMTLGRGSRIPLDAGRVLRLFVYWKEVGMRTDLDLSLIQYDHQMQYSGHVSYTNLQNQGIVHSGDIQSAPHGAAEFIDVDIRALPPLDRCRYIAPQIYRYAGDSFANLTCHSGWMLREKTDSSYSSFDIKTVQNKFDLNGSTSFCLPIVIDLLERQIIFVDLYVGKVEQHNRVERSTEDISIITREMIRMIQTRPNLFDLATHHAKARGGTIVHDRSEADVAFGVDEGDFKASDISKWLSEML